MTIIRHEIYANCPPARIWELLADLEAVRRYNPTVRDALVRGALRTGVGAERVCDLLPRGRVVERVIHWEEGRAVGLEVAESDWPIHYMRWVTRVDGSAQGSVLSQGLEYEVKFGPLGWLVDRLAMKRKLTRTLDEIFANLIKLAETHASGAQTAGVTSSAG